jgi:hypothetical protein
LFPDSSKRSFSSQKSPDRLRAHPAFCSVVTGGRGVEMTTVLHLVARVKNERSYISTPPTCLHGVDRDNAYVERKKVQYAIKRVIHQITHTGVLLSGQPFSKT